MKTVVYSNAIYSAIHFDRLTEDLLSSIRVKQKSQKSNSKNNSNLNKIKD